MRKKEAYINIEPLNIEDLSLIPKADLHPIIFDEIYILK